MPVCQFPLPVPGQELGDCQVWSCRGGCSDRQAPPHPRACLSHSWVGYEGSWWCPKRVSLALDLEVPTTD